MLSSVFEWNLRATGVSNLMREEMKAQGKK